VVRKPEFDGARPSRGPTDRRQKHERRARQRLQGVSLDGHQPVCRGRREDVLRAAPMAAIASAVSPIRFATAGPGHH